MKFEKPLIYGCLQQLSNMLMKTNNIQGSDIFFMDEAKMWACTISKSLDTFGENGIQKLQLIFM
jgi:hypothetical protein